MVIFTVFAIVILRKLTYNILSYRGKAVISYNTPWNHFIVEKAAKSREKAEEVIKDKEV